MNPNKRQKLDPNDLWNSYKEEYLEAKRSPENDVQEIIETYLDEAFRSAKGVRSFLDSSALRPIFTREYAKIFETTPIEVVLGPFSEQQAADCIPPALRGIAMLYPVRQCLGTL